MGRPLHSHMVKYALRRLALSDLRLGQWVNYRGGIYKVVAVSCLFDDPYVHLAPDGDDWDKVVEVYGRDLLFIFPTKVHPK